MSKFGEKLSRFLDRFAPPEPDPLVPAGPDDIVNPLVYSASKIKGCVVVKMDERLVKNPFQERDEEGERINKPDLVENYTENGWKIASISWRRTDEHANYGHDPAVNQQLCVVLVKLC